MIREGDPEAVPHINAFVLGIIFDGVFAFPDSYDNSPLLSIAGRQASRWVRQAKYLDNRGQTDKAATMAEKAFTLTDQNSLFGSDYVMILGRTGRLHEALAQMAILAADDFAHDYHRRRVLKWLPHCGALNCPQGLEVNLAEYLGENTTASSMDYLARAEYAFRLGEWEVMKQVVDDFHYAGSARREVLDAIATTMLSRRDNPDWSHIESALRSELAAYGGSILESYDFWLAILDREFGDAPEWDGIKQRARFEDIAQLHHHSKQLWLPLKEDEAAKILNWYQKTTEAFLEEDGPWQTGVDDWKLKAVLDEHRALGKWIALQTDRFRTSPAPSVIETAATGKGGGVC